MECWPSREPWSFSKCSDLNARRSSSDSAPTITCTLPSVRLDEVRMESRNAEIRPQYSCRKVVILEIVCIVHAFTLQVKAP